MVVLRTISWRRFRNTRWCNTMDTVFNMKRSRLRTLGLPLVCFLLVMYSFMRTRSQQDLLPEYMVENYIGPQPSLRLRNATSRASIFCMVHTTDNNLNTKAKAVNDTWAKRCNHTVFFSNQPSNKADVIYLKDVKDGRKHLTQKSMLSFDYVFTRYSNYDWYVKADDDTYIVVDNLRYLLSHYNSRNPVYLGQNFKFFVKQGYNSGGASYVLSKNALEKLSQGLRSKKCKSDGNDEDVDVGKCLDSQGVLAYDTTDSRKRETFHGSTIEDHLVGPLSDLLQRYPSTRARTGKDCCSPLTISFHYMQPNMMYITDMMLYHLIVHGRDYKREMDAFESSQTIT